MKKILTSLLMAVAALGAWAASPEVVFDLTTQAAFNQCTQSNPDATHSADYQAWSFGYRGLQMYNYNISEGKYHDFLFTPDLALEGGCEYSVTLAPSCMTYYDVEGEVNTLVNLKVWYGQGDDLSNYKLLGTIENIQFNNYAPKEYEYKFVIRDAGNYKVAFEGYVNSMYLQKTKVYSYGSSDVPATPDDFTITPDPDGAKKATVTFTMPSTTRTFKPMTGATYTLFRGLEKVQSDVAAEGGAKIEYVDTQMGETGTVIYSVQITCGDQVSEKLSGQTYVGLETATAPKNVKFVLGDGGYVVSWTAPETGTHGVALQPEKLTYSLVRYVDGVEQWISDDIKETTYTDTYTTDEIKKLKYAVAAKYGSAKKFTTYTESKENTIGNMKLPFYDSFANATIDPTWTNENVIPEGQTHASYFWQLKEHLKNTKFFRLDTRETYYADILPYDDDNGFIVYDNMSYGNAARLITAPIAYQEGEKPMLRFSHFENQTHSRDTLQIQIRLDKDEWINIEGAQFINGGNEAEAWREANVSLSDYIKAGTSEYEVGFLATRGQTYAQYVALDAVKIVNEVDKDLSIDMFTVPEKIVAGKDFEMTVKVGNNGKDEVAADAYTVTFDHNFPGKVEISELQAIPSMGSVVYTVSVPVDALQLLNAENFQFMAKVNYAGDETPGNNASVKKQTVPAYSEGNGAEILESSKDDDSNVTIKWEPATDLIRTPVKIRESFEGFTEDSWGPFNGWTVIDIDGKPGQTCYSASGSVFNVTEYKNNSTPGNRDGDNVLGVTVKGGAQQDDWIISPKVDCVPEGEMMLNFLFGMKDPLSSTTAPDYTIEILYTTDDSFDKLNPIKTFTKKVETLKFTLGGAVAFNNKLYRVATTEPIPGEATYVALHFITKYPYDYGMWIDDINLYEELGNPLQGYNVYSLATGSRLNEELLEPTATEYTFAVEAAEEAQSRANYTSEPCVFVAAVYPDGEAAPKNIWNYETNSAAGDIKPEPEPEPETVVTTIVSDGWANLEVYTGADKTGPVALAGKSTEVETEKDAVIYIFAKADCYISSISDTAEGTYTVPATSVEISAAAANTVTIGVTKVVRDKNLIVFVGDKAATLVALELSDATMPAISSTPAIKAGYNTLKFATDDELKVVANGQVELYVDGEKVDATRPVTDLTEATVVKVFVDTPQSWTMNYSFGEGVDVEVYHDHITKIESPATHSVFHGTHVAIKPVVAQPQSRAEEADKLEVKVNGTILEPNADGFYEFTAEKDVEIKVAKASSGLESILIEGTDAEIYNLQGLKVKAGNLAPGVYIIRANGTSHKVMVK